MKHRRAVLGSLMFGLLVSFGAWAIGTAERPCKVVSQDSASPCGSRGDLVDAALSGGGPTSSREPSRTFEPGGSEPSRVLADGIAEGAAEVLAPEGGLLADGAASAMAEALAGFQAGTRSAAFTDAAQPISQAERDAFRLAAQDCWRFDPRSPAGQSAVTVGFHLDGSGRVTGPVQLVWHDAPTREAADQAYQAASHAILNCQDEVVLLASASDAETRRAELTFEAQTWAIR